MKEFIIQSIPEYKLKLKTTQCKNPIGLTQLQFVKENKKDGKVTHTSTSEFFLNENEIKMLITSLGKING
jgi:hypothetical protein